MESQNCTVNKEDLEHKVKAMYRDVALSPLDDYHFELGRELALKLGYDAQDLDKVPPTAVDSFAGVGYHFGLAAIRQGEKVLDLGSGSGMDLFVAASKAGETGVVTGVDFTPEQVLKSRKLADDFGFRNLYIVDCNINDLPFPDQSFDVIISNGVINLLADKEHAFREISRLLNKGGRMAISDIVTQVPLPGSIKSNSTLWAACIGGASYQTDYQKMISEAGLKIQRIVDNDKYKFTSPSAQGATREFGVKSISILAVKE